jgi:circadian clock protein KaiC
MANRPKTTAAAHGDAIRKCPTGIVGFDQITGGGLPTNRNTLICGGAGSGKTLLGIDFLVNGAARYGEPGVLMSFEESGEELYENVASINLDLRSLVAQDKIRIEHVVLKQRDIQESDFNLEGVLMILDDAIDSIGAKRVVLDSIESLFAGIGNVATLRLEIKRLFRWLKGKRVTTIITGEPGLVSYTRQGLEEYISDCVISLDNRVNDQLTVRRIRIVKYRGSDHGMNEYPFVIDGQGLSVIPVTSAGLNQPGTRHRISTGMPTLDKLFHGGGYAKGSTVLVSGTAGTGKTSLAMAFATANCKRGERCLFISYEESPGQLIQNMGSIGFHLEPLVKKGLLKFVSTRPSFIGLEKHLLSLYQTLEAFRPSAVVIDPLTSLLGQGSPLEIQSMLTRMIDMLKSKGITGFFTSLVSSNAQNETGGEIGVSSLIDTWIVVRELEESQGMKRTRGLFIVKSRGMGHSSDVHKLIMDDSGMTLEPMKMSPIEGPRQKVNLSTSISGRGNGISAKNHLGRE